ncbi:hypothetical protein [Cellvibrio sp. PSBB006]|uniref:hypothetical protein n=1 Tax=Cellvibrio sp. PSBB006 TaxID=1987723 RepID=UPI000B3B3B56|nr:hypothetical protein [Cellvibrio sp. PSBB006]ARU28481.1 hypothetical protein CBR65_14110 [Cellvibrio sp. PSBB006]
MRAIAAVTLFFASCIAHGEIRQPLLHPNEAVQAAEQFLTEKGISTKGFSIYSLTFDYIKRKWWVSYQMDLCPCPIGGDHFTVRITSEAPLELQLDRGL